jgi:hypothetical protein
LFVCTMRAIEIETETMMTLVTVTGWFVLISLRFFVWK